MLKVKFNTERNVKSTSNFIKLIAFYLPQYHPVHENNKWWGKGFCEWRNVAQGKPLFPNHYQPHIPADLGFYDLRLPESREAQAKMALDYGIYGFCYYHYWFNGRRILERPFTEVLASGKPKIPFCLCWANENWTRTWDGGNQNILLKQNYSHEDDQNHMKCLISAFKDKRYIRINGKPLFLVYRTELLPFPAKTAEIWREIAYKEGIGDIYLARVESFENNIIPEEIGFDAAVEFAPDWRNLGEFRRRGVFNYYLYKLGFIPKCYFRNMVTDYQEMSEKMMRKSDPDYVWMRCITPSFDNSVRRRKGGAVILYNSTPEKYEVWLNKIINWTLVKRHEDESLVFINAWNEWGEGNHLEPDLKWGTAYLEATRRLLNNSV